MTDHTELIGRELVSLIRGAKELQSVLVPERGCPVIDPSAFALLSSIAELGPVRVSALAGKVFLDLSTISRQIQELEQAGWVVRERDQQDKRVSLLRLSDSGSAVLAAGRAQRHKVLQRVLAGWDPDECSALAHHLSRFNAELAAFTRQETP